MEIFITVVLFLFVFSFLVLIHEWGHFIVARRNGIRVEEFSLGLPPKAFGLYKDKKGTVYSVGWIPFGGYVRMYGEDDDSPDAAHGAGSYASKSRWIRAKVVLAGVVMNFLLAFVLLWGLFQVGIEPFILSLSDFEYYQEQGVLVTEPGIFVTSVVPDSNAEKAGFLEGDVILKLNGTGVTSSQSLIDGSQELKGMPATYSVRRDEDVLTLTSDVTDEGKIGVVISDVPLIKEVHKIRKGVGDAFISAGYESFRLIGATAVAFVGVIKSTFSLSELAPGVVGPVGIASLTHDFAQKGLLDFLKFVALLSLSLAAVNVLPIPALDGGRFLFILVELVRRKKADPTWETRIHALGFMVLICIIVFVTYKDVVKLFQ